MPDDVLILTIAIPLLTAVTAAAVSGEKMRRIVSAAGTSLHLIANAAILYLVRADGIQVMQVGGWPAPHGITLVVDHLSGMLLVVAAAIGLAAVVRTPRLSGTAPQRASSFPFIQVLLASVCGALVAGDVFNLYVWFELMLLTSFVLMVLGRTRRQLEGAVKYALTNIVGSVFFVAGIGFLYGITGTLNLADLAVRLQDAPRGDLATISSIFFVLAFGLKSGAFPLYFWLPASYPALAAPVGALFAGLLTKVGVYAMIRMFTLVFVQEPALTHTLILWMGAATMIFGVTGALAQQSYRRLISYLMITAVGFMLVGLGMNSVAGLTGSIFYLLEDSFAVAALFMLGAVVRRPSARTGIRALGGFYERSPVLAFLFFIPAFSLAGFPPLAGFWSKVLLARAGVELSAYVVVTLLLVTALLVLVAVLKAWFEGDGESVPKTEQSTEARADVRKLLPAAALAGVTIALTLFAGFFIEAAGTAADDLMHPQRYIEHVLNP